MPNRLLSVEAVGRRQCLKDLSFSDLKHAKQNSRYFFFAVLQIPYSHKTIISKSADSFKILLNSLDLRHHPHSTIEMY